MRRTGKSVGNNNEKRRDKRARPDGEGVRFRSCWHVGDSKLALLMRKHTDVAASKMW